MANETQITLTIPDIETLFKTPEDLTTWVTTDLSKVIVARLQALKDASIELKSATAKAIVLDDPKIDLRGVGVRTGFMA